MELDEDPTFEDVMELIDKYIWYWAHKYSSSVHNMEVSDLHQEGLLKLYDIYSSSQYSGKPVVELIEIFKKSLLHLYADLYHRYRREKRLFEVDSEKVEIMVVKVDGFSNVHLQYLQEHLNQYLSPDAALMLETLLHPTPAVYHLHHIHVMRRKTVQRQGGVWRVPTKIAQQTVGLALGLKEWETKERIRELQNVWREHQKC